MVSEDKITEARLKCFDHMKRSTKESGKKYFMKWKLVQLNGVVKT